MGTSPGEGVHTCFLSTMLVHGALSTLLEASGQLLIPPLSLLSITSITTPGHSFQGHLDFTFLLLVQI